MDGGVYFDNTTSLKGSTYYADNTRDFSVNIRLGEVVKTNSVVGLTASYSNYTSHQPGFADSNYNRINQFTGGAFYRRYKKVLKDFYFFGELEGVFSHLNERYGSSNFLSSGITTSNGGTVSLTPGISYSICKNLQVDLLLPNLLAASYTHSSLHQTEGLPSVSSVGKSNDFSFNGNLSSNLLSDFGIGFQFLLGK